ncbi:pyridoxal-dependent decarboxylase [Phycicoccus sp. CSK15P-2]|uniref:pyridoxal phosphate-dependent decarboxylase family protein n=1 Tax=Phycicoccus sp. CSK15P-2 TaxID=2807627 RepID=UPI00194DDB8F|nr:pyridoxal-dependent decarboxylase [Phycicoccus sp. CSK15P-2]MBM6403044.1 pyridoxal-dependent decarboxylase [Phycicoccus sp. CSK15P-2]
MTAQLLTRDTAGDLLLATRLAVAEVADAMARAARPVAPTDPATARRRIARVDLDRPLPSWDAVLAELRRVWLDDAVWFHHPRYQAHLNCPVTVESVAADVMATAVNTSMDTWDQSTSATMVERRLLAWVAGRLRLPDEAGGVFTTGGTQSNLHGLLLAREHAVAVHGGRAGLLPRLRVLCSVDAHDSIRRGAHLLGLGSDAVVEVGVDVRRRMDPHALASALDAVRAEGGVPMAVVATAGTTDAGAVDPLADVVAQARGAGAWAHVDAAYGGGLVTSHRHRGLLDGVQHADSVTVDFHKTFFLPVAASALVVRDAALLELAVHHSDYLNPEGADDDRRPNQVDVTLQTTRRFDALKLWCTLRASGADAIGEHLDTVVDLARTAARHVAAAPDCEILVAPQLSTVLFRVVTAGQPEEDDRLNDRAREGLFDDGVAAVGATRVDGRTWLKLTLLNPATTPDEVAEVVDLVRDRVHALAADDPGGARSRQAVVTTRGEGAR